VSQQLALFNERRRRAPPAIERRTHIALADLLRRLARAGWIWMHIPNGELRTKATGKLLKRMGVLAGTLDFLLIGPDGQHYWLELKRGRAEPSDKQLEFIAGLRERNVPHAVAHSFDEAVDYLKRWDVLRPFSVQV
jgi:hypothetical protein